MSKSWHFAVRVSCLLDFEVVAFNDNERTYSMKPLQFDLDFLPAWNFEWNSNILLGKLIIYYYNKIVEGCYQSNLSFFYVSNNWNWFTYVCNYSIGHNYVKYFHPQNKDEKLKSCRKLFVLQPYKEYILINRWI